ncbi:DNA repair metallo-beta-lactamase domain-containing protein [Trichoderma breve]|uniref:DNA repair metallo-beta-lactamase domain-containing protein n=1 Tax=Trichoderma breve TaxID=2034170 RepID=A0A9W9BKB3_9HYPO|nr:DNA repair metallo-beta-lactamase domain-containing protein [Trichoderma breve]KAJ4861131.1 DNA repair metallo-beta-lactamase domain-containing protein [Trichoderma breve]
MVTSTKTNRMSTPKKAAAVSSFNKKPAKPNASILSFFQKTAKPEDSLFVGAVPAETADKDDLYGRDDGNRFNEVEAPNKKRRTPFVMDSDSEDDDVDDNDNDNSKPVTPPQTKDANTTAPSPPSAQPEPSSETAEAQEANVKYEPPPLLEQETSTDIQFNQLGDFADLDDFEIDEFEGEEMREMRFMREQARLEAQEAGVPGDDLDDLLDNHAMVENCPLCGGSLLGISPDEATRHVNSCLDGNPIPLPTKEDAAPKDVDQVEAVEISKRFARAAVPRPGQANPFEMNTEKTTKSAFSKLMSGNAEDSAWATAAAAETASRGRPAYERTCPFYKIMPGFSICVDAFRYGAVEGCQAYFLSHFHSDHYIGLTANWRHGPIYCSKVTGSLVKQQLRTAAKWVVELEFEKPYDVPGTEGATVTMMPANHCPGSSLFLFQKSFGNGPNKRAKRILHCGDFRACPEHVQHPLLRPDVIDSISGKSRQQRIDICYLDTTYLNPRYSFPPQGDVIQACADLCGSMSADPNCADDVWQSDKPSEDDTKSKAKSRPKQRLLVICGTYSIGKERICVAIAKALGSKIFASPGKIKICKQLDDPELTSLLTSDPVEAQVHMQMLMEIRAETLQEYLDSYRPHFSRIVGFRPSGWNFRPGNGKAIGANTPPSSISTQQLLHGKGWRTRFGVKDLVAQRGSTKEAMCFGVPYSEHSSFRELAMFVMSLRIDKVIPTVNVGSDQSRKRMKGWIDRWMTERRKGGLVRPLIEGEDDEHKNDSQLWQGKAGEGGGAWW